MMYELDRIVAIIKPTQLFLDWVQQLPDNDDIELSDLCEDCTALLIPAFDSPEEADQYMMTIYEDIFANELDVWDESMDTWPTERSFERFKLWFNIEYHSMVFDTVEEEDSDFEFDEDLDDLEEDEDHTGHKHN